MTRLCDYCGRETHGLIACYAHKDLPALDPVFSPDVPQRKAEPIEASRTEELLDRLLQEGA